MYFLYANPLKPETVRAAGKLAGMLVSSGQRVVLDDWLHSRLGTGQPGTLESLTAEYDAVIALGGDGTLLRVVHAAASKGIPMLGINLGRVGFLLETEPRGMQATVERLIDRDYFIEERMMLQAAVDDQPPQLIINDVVVSRGANPASITVEVMADGELLYATRGDGVIVSTPTGSTAYCLAAGGPVLHPKMKAMVVLPICTHRSQQMPMVLDGDVSLSLKALAVPGRSHQLIMDGKAMAEKPGEVWVAVRRAAVNARFIRLEEQRFFTRLRLKQAEWSNQ